MSSRAWARPAAGREPAAAALLAWLADPGAPRLCLVTGSPGCGKSQLLAWLVGHGTRPTTAAARRVHSFVPLGGQTARTTGWAIAGHLSVAARTPGELVQALAADTRPTVIVLPDLHAADDVPAVTELITALHDLEQVRLIVEIRAGNLRAQSLFERAPALMDLDEERWTDTTRRALWNAEHAESRQRAPQATVPDPGPDPDDPRAVCAADPWAVCALYERSRNPHRGLRAAWLRAAQSLTREQAPGERALVLRAALGDEADPRLAQELDQHSTGSTWQLLWTRVRGDIRPPWPGPARALATGHAPAPQLLWVADHQGTVRAVNEADATPHGRLPHQAAPTRALAAGPDGTVLVLDAHGRVDAAKPASPAAPTGLQALLEDHPSHLDTLLGAVNARLRACPGSALAAAGKGIAVADTEGAVHAFTPGAKTPMAHTAGRLHDGAVSALTAVETASADGTAFLVYSGGTDGRVRAWRTDTEPLTSPVASRPCAVTALSAARTSAGLALAIGWADGLVEHHGLDTGVLRRFFPGLPVRCVALTADGHLVVGTDETLTCLKVAERHTAAPLPG
ncbi:hypothetical protein AB0O01_00300 [Streptomyces sp. NPDC093252]|uniref:hypothetical protein n=1 Tax=Streptomyces sp. NPDC093252 TaxID=3154980 RepID=UPI0034155770